MYSIGNPAEPLPADPRFSTREEAEIAALELSLAHDDAVLAVWEDEHGEVLALVFAGIVYQP